MSDPKKSMRMAGVPLQLAAALIESPGSGALLFRVASKQLGIDQLHEASIAGDVPPYRPLHLGRARAIPSAEK